MKYTNNKRSHLKSWPITALTAAVIIGITAVAQSTNAATALNRKPIGDLEIYAPAKPGTATIFMMLDTSGSMGDGFIKEDYGNSYNGCSASAINSEKISAIIYKRKRDPNADDGLLRDAEGNTVKDLNNKHATISFTPRGCTPSRNPTRYSRLVRLQIALIELLADDVLKSGNLIEDKGSLSDAYEIGLGNYSYEGDGRSGVVVVSTKALTAEQRFDLIKATEKLTATGGTPTAHALAESGAYMMGTTTAYDAKVVGERQRKGWFNYEYRQCIINDNVLSFDSNSGLYVYACKTFSNRWNNNSISGDLIDNTYYSSINADSGFKNAVETAVKTDEGRYISPLNPKECSGNGIYLLTDGEPQLVTENGRAYESLTGSSNRAKALMNVALQGSSLSVSSCNGLTGGSASGAWGCMAEYAQLLRNPANNPLGLPIKTATVGFGKDFDGLTGTHEITINGKSKTVIDCESGRNVGQDTRNLCRLGERRGDNEVKTFGDGGFYYTEESSEIAASIVDFASGLVQIINTAPSGTITIPNDPYRAANQLPYAYLPMLDPDISSTAAIWRGNLKKYALNNGTLFGNNDKQLYKDIVGNLEEKTQDLWQTADFKADAKVANNNIAAGGFYAQLKTPSSGPNSERTIYVEDTLADKKTPFLRKLGVKNGKLEGFNDLVDPVYTKDNEINKRRLLSFLGFDGLIRPNGLATDNTLVKNLTLKAPTQEIKVLGGVVHSKPEAVSYNSVLDANGRITEDRDDYVLFGSMDGALHLADADDGKEAFAIIPKSMMLEQPEALVDGSTKDRAGEPYFGVDAPWLVTTDYSYDLDAKKVKVDGSAGKGMFAYGGLRMGGEAFYGMDITKKSEPKILFTITSAGLSSSTNAKSTTSGFARLGQIWGKPTAAKVRIRKDADPIDVLVFGGGYDMAYEDDSYVPTTENPAQGNSVYMINAKTGELLWSTSVKATDSKGGKNATNMIHSITGEVTVLDRDNDGLIDHLYVADLGGQVFRADFENARIARFGFAAVDSFSSKGVTRILNTAPAAATDKKYAYRFYERPVVSFHRGEAGVNNGKIFAVVNVISGNRSAPLSKLRNSSTYANRVYGIIDSDVTKSDIYNTGFSAKVKDLTEGQLTNLGTELTKIASATTGSARGDLKDKAKKAMIDGSKQGWYYPLTRFDGYDNVRYNKGVGDSVVINNLLYTTVYNPDKTFGTVASCAAKIMGGSERQLYCLPYGICMDEDSRSGTGGYIPAGQGIQELTLGAYNKDNTDVKVLIGTTTITERIQEAKRLGYGSDDKKNSSNIKDLYSGEGNPAIQAGGDGTAAEFLFNERYTLQPRAWYQQKQKETVRPVANP